MTGRDIAFVKRVLAVLVLPAMLAIAAPAAAQTGAQCAGLDDDAARLVCYDDLFRTNAPPSDADAVVFESEQLIPARPSGRAPATITVSCEANGLQVAFGFAGNTLSSLGNDVGMTLQYDLTRRSSTLPVDRSNTAVLIDNSRDALAFIDNLAGVTNLTVRVTPTSARTLSVRFRVDSFAQSVAPVVAACS
jgi:type VI secretion system protein VasI